ncbi:ABC transporter permease subunit [Cellulomonas aerilata]|uniref:ABC transporter permease n=1 Tax=Cellulomonas aerilata TaxID=515326 RepID=A0A512DDZ3_9CELL|nr:ABC transporter permease subunit [Cellulomonas aerilata]GEO34667.1 ABC transporter permease [Cellulomonas aerilata]
MTTLTADTRRTGPAHRPDRGTERLTFGRVVASEWVKLRTLRSTWWTLGVTVVLMVGIAALVAWGMTQGDEPAPPGMGIIAVTAGTQMAQLAVAVLGVLIITGEYTTGMVRSTFAAVPTRLPALAAKAIVLGVTVLVVGAISTALSYGVTLPFVSGTSLEIDLGDADTVRALVGVPLYLAAIALLALGFGALLRHSAGALAAVLGLLLVIENVVALIPLRFFEAISPYLPATAGSQVMMPSDFAFADPDALGAWQGYGVMLAWVAVVIAVAAVLMRRRDA